MPSELRIELLAPSAEKAAGLPAAPALARRQRFFLLVSAGFLLLAVLVGFRVNQLEVLQDRLALLARGGIHRDLGLYPHGNRHIEGGLTKETAFTQTFVSPFEELGGIDLFVSTFARPATMAYAFDLFDGEGRAVRTVELSPERIRDNDFHKIIFEPVGNAQGRRFSFTVTPRGGPAGSPITLQISQPGTYEEGRLVLNGALRDDDVVFRPLGSGIPPVQHVRHYLDFFLVQILACTLLGVAILYRFFGIRAVFLFILVLGLYYSFARKPYSVLDEGAHFDYINAIFKEHRLPLAHEPHDGRELSRLAEEVGDVDFALPYSMPRPRYEAVHPPLYYLLGAGVSWLVSFFTDSVAARFYAMRLLGVLCLLTAAMFAIRSVDLLREHGKIAMHELTAFAVILLFFAAPAVLFVVIPVTNDQLVMPLMSILVWFLVRISLQSEASVRDGVIAGLLMGGLLLTKLTAAYVIVVVGMFFLLRGFGRPAIVCVASAGGVALPWFAFNWMNYGAMTGMKPHLDFVMPIVNPHGIPVTAADIASRLHELVAGFLFLPERNHWLVMIGHFVTMAILLALVLFLVETVTGKESHPSHEWRGVRFLFPALVVCNFLYLLAGTFQTDIYAVHPRYMYMNLAPLAMMTCVSVSATLKERYLNWFSWLVIGIAIVFLHEHFNGLV
jgi:hypothetical protein